MPVSDPLPQRPHEAGKAGDRAASGGLARVLAAGRKPAQVRLGLSPWTNRSSPRQGTRIEAERLA